MDECNDCGATLRKGQLNLCKTCNQNMRENLVNVVEAPVDAKPAPVTKRIEKAVFTPTKAKKRVPRRR